MSSYERLKIEYDKVVNRRKMTKPHTHTYFELYYLVSGKTAYYVGDEIFRLKPHDFIMVPKGVIHSNDSESCLNNERILITFSADAIDENIKPFVDMLCEQKLIHIPENKLYIFEDILLKVQNETASSPLVRLYVLELSVLLCRYKTNAGRSEDGITEKVSEYIKANYGEGITLQGLGARFGISESHLSRKFKAETGHGLWEYITQVRIFNAQRLLKEGKTVTEVSGACGFSDSNYFATVFKKLTGTTPCKYKKTYF